MASYVQPSASHFAQSPDTSTRVTTDGSQHPTQSHNIIDNSLDNNLENTPAYHTKDIANTEAPLRVHVERVVREYFLALGDELPTDLYELILKEVERPLLTVVLEQSRGNQTKCAQILGLNRGTLRKKLKAYDLMS